MRVLIVVFSLLMPMMICAAPATQMNESEKACCEQMHGMCGSMQMKHSCCVSTPGRMGSPSHEALTAHAERALILAPMNVFIETWNVILQPSSVRSDLPESPPGPLAPVLESSILRI
jgi:hypothetical protein